MGAHLVDGEFQSDKYPTTPRGKVPLSVKDKTAQDLLWQYAQRRRAIDAEFSDDLETALRSAGYLPSHPPSALDLPAILARAEQAMALAVAATVGPWSMGKNRVGYVYAADCVTAKCGDFKNKELTKFNGKRWNADAAFIADARTSVPAICADNASLVERVRELERAMEPFLAAAARLAALGMLNDPSVGKPGDYFTPAQWRALIVAMSTEEPAPRPPTESPAP